MKKIIFAIALLLGSLNTMAQDNKITRIARITVDPAQLDSYRLLLKEQMEAATRLEPGVISYTVYAEKDSSNRLTIVEVYADNAAYLKHRDAPHFKKYKAATQDMVRSLELSEVTPILAVPKQ